MVIASAGQTSTQDHSLHKSLFTTAFSFSMVIAAAGHSSTQVHTRTFIFINNCSH
jgi:hypothetical protein